MKLALKSTAELLSELRHQRSADLATVRELERRWEETTATRFMEVRDDGRIAKWMLEKPNFAILAGTER